MNAQRLDPAPAVNAALFRGAMVVAPALLLASTVLSAVGGGLGEDAAGGTVQVYAMAAFGIALFGLARRLADHQPRAAAVLTVLAALGVAGGVGYGIDALHGAAHPGLPLDELAAGAVALQAPGLMFPVSLIGLGLGLARSGVGPRWAGLGLAVGGVVFPVSRIGSVEGLAVIADAVLLISLIGFATVDARLRETARPSVPAPVPATR